MTDYRIIDIAANTDLVGASRLSKRDMLSMLGIVWRTDPIVDKSKVLRAKTMAVEAADLGLELRENGSIGQDTNLVFRLDPAVNWSRDPSLLNSIREKLSEYSIQRNPTNPQIMIYSANYAHRVEVLSDPSGQLSAVDKATILKTIQDAELSGFVTRSRALFEHGGSAFFFTPSESFHDYFIRIGNTQSLRPFSEASFFWSLPQLEGATHFFAENWSISTTAATFAKMQGIYCGNDNATWRFAYAYFPKSPEDRDVLRSELDDCERSGGRFVLLNSFNSTGNLEKGFFEIAKKSRCKDFSMISFFFDSLTSAPEHECLLDIAKILRERDLTGGAKLPLPTGAPIFNVDSRTYFPEYRRINVSKFRFGELDYEKSFFEKYSAKEIFSVNRRGRNSPKLQVSVTPGGMRHHAFHIDASRMFGDTEFRQGLASKLQGRPPATVCITNGTDASLRLADACIHVSGQQDVKVLVCDDPTFRELLSTPRLSEVLDDESQRVFICVPLVISGDTLSNVQIKLRQIEREFGPASCDISVLVGVLRPESPDKLGQLRDLYLRNPENKDFDWVEPVIAESVLLPNWQEDRCPWQREREFLKYQMRHEHLTDDEYFAHSQRTDWLIRSQAIGLRGAAVFNTEDTVRLRFNPNSFWLDDNQLEGEVDFLGVNSTETRSDEADLCCAVASALQYWRSVAARKDWRFNVIDASTITNLNGFNEARLRAAIWRGLTQAELQNTSRSEESNDLRTLLEKIFLSVEYDENYTPLKMEARIAFKSEIERCIGLEQVVA